MDRSNPESGSWVTKGGGRIVDIPLGRHALIWVLSFDRPPARGAPPARHHLAELCKKVRARRSCRVVQRQPTQSKVAIEGRRCSPSERALRTPNCRATTNVEARTNVQRLLLRRLRGARPSPRKACKGQGAGKGSVCPLPRAHCGNVTVVIYWRRKSPSGVEAHESKLRARIPTMPCIVDPLVTASKRGVSRLICAPLQASFPMPPALSGT